jgi:hypothetical protein
VSSEILRRFTIDEIVFGPRPGHADPTADELWFSLRRVFLHAEAGHPLFDPRRRLGLSHLEQEMWVARRREWLRTKIFADDSRVIL